MTLGGWGETFLAGANFHARSCSSQPLKVYSYFEKGCGKKMCTPQSRKAIWDMVNTLFLTLQLSNLLLLLSFSTHKHMSMVSRAILSSFFEEQWTQNHPQSLSGLSRALFPTTFFEIAEDKYGDKKPSFHLALGYRIKRRGSWLVWIV